MRHEQDGPANNLDLADDSDGRSANPQPVGRSGNPVSSFDGRREFSLPFLARWIDRIAEEIFQPEDRDCLVAMWIKVAMRPMGPYPPLVIQVSKGR